ncbi:GIY-YIG nuclease family protein [Algoriphagus yeomjeoni]|uniref:GIY-YIG nuclease family protein n=1 Tax=Algoriphagus yeomjeoni TaxID=291403 RepID=UPI003CE4FAFD
MFVVYILYSVKVDQFYIGQSEDFGRRIEEHNSHIFQSASTKITNDWSLYFSLECETRAQAVRIESHIKKSKSRVYLENIKKYPEITEKLLLRYK